MKKPEQIKSSFYIYLSVILLFTGGHSLFAQKKDTVVSKFKTELISFDNDLSEKSIKYVKRGDFIFSLGPLKYEQALEEYFKALEISPDNSLLNFKVGYCYLNINKFKSRSILYLEKALIGTGKKIDPKIRFYLGKAYQVNHNPERAIEEYKKYILEVKKELKPETKGAPLEIAELSRLQEKDIGEAYKKIDECRNFLKFYKNPVKVKLLNMGDSINSPYAEYDPFISLDESDLYYTTRRPTTKGGGRAEKDGQFYEDIYVSHKRNGKWGKARPMRGINKKTNDAITGLSFDGTKMFIYRDANGGDIFLSELKGRWSKLSNIKEINSEFHESSACLSVDGKTLYFVSDRPGGEGGRDIYMSALDAEGKWSKPANLGPDINTSFDEDRIYVHPYTKALFFSSKGHNSLGGYDIFVCDYENGAWAKPKNLGYPINDVDDDFSFVVTDDMKHGYYSSFKENGKGEKDIYFIDFENTESDSALKSLNVDFKKITYDDSVNATIVALNQKISKNPLAYINARQLHILDSLARKNGKISGKAISKTSFGELPFRLSDIKKLDSIARADHNITAIAVDKVVNSNKDLAAINLNRKQLNLLDSIAKSNRKITAEMLLRADFRGKQISADQLSILDSIARVNGAITAITVGQTNFANLNKDILLNENIAQRIDHKIIEPGISMQQLYILDSIAKVNGKITTAALNKTKFFNANQPVLLTSSPVKNVKTPKTLTSQQLQILDSVAKANGSITVEALSKTNFVVPDKSDTVSGPASQSNKFEVTESALTSEQLHILDSLAKTNRSITSASLDQTNFATIEPAALPGDIIVVEEKKFDLTEGMLTSQQFHKLDSLTKVKETLSAAIISKRVNAFQNNTTNTTDNSLNLTDMLSDRQLVILDSLAKAKKQITISDLSNTNFISDGQNVSDKNNISKNEISSIGLTDQQIRILDSLAKVDESITLYALNKVNFSARDPRASHRNILIQETNYAADETAFTEHQLHILDSLAKTNKRITGTLLSKTTFGVIVEYANGSILTNSNADTSGRITISKKQIRILDSLAGKNKSITASMLAKAHFTERKLNNTTANTTTTALTVNNNNSEKNDLTRTATNSNDTNNMRQHINSQDNTLAENNTEISPGNPIDLPAFSNILFEFNKYELSKESNSQLDKLIIYLLQYSAHKVKITGYTDSKGSDTYNLILSKKRAMAVSTYLTLNGINKKRMSLDYKGESHPVAPNENPDKSDNTEGRNLNRRVEMKIVLGTK
ncbi:MAG: OmpA family protein [Bacteroidetes bacterium]|nr:OmpA family protein [Bacteroidota bacterium]